MLNDEIERALVQLREVIANAIRAEQATDELTKLPNNLALTEHIDRAIRGDTRFWLAFVEIDHFKKVNLRFGHEAANLLLQRLASTLAERAVAFEPRPVAFRAHGDEFYLLGAFPNRRGASALLDAFLDDLRRTVQELRVQATAVDEPMSCTVSVGWASDEDLLGAGVELSDLALREAVEQANGAAKRRGRNRVVRFSSDIHAEVTLAERDMCGECRTNFTADIPQERAGSADMYCPNCGARIPRAVRGSVAVPEAEV